MFNFRLSFFRSYYTFSFEKGMDPFFLSYGLNSTSWSVLIWVANILWKWRIMNLHPSKLEDRLGYLALNLESVWKNSEFKFALAVQSMTLVGQYLILVLKYLTLVVQPLTLAVQSMSLVVQSLILVQQSMIWNCHYARRIIMKLKYNKL